MALNAAAFEVVPAYHAEAVASLVIPAVGVGNA